MDDEYWETKALLLRILEPNRFKGLTVAALPFDESNLSLSNSYKSCVLVGVVGSLDNRTAMCLAARRIIKEQGS